MINSPMGEQTEPIHFLLSSLLSYFKQLINNHVVLNSPVEIVAQAIQPQPRIWRISLALYTDFVNCTW